MVITLAVRAGVSHFLQVVIMVGLVGTLGMLIYSGALDLFAGWGDVQQITIQSVYKVGNDVQIVVANKGSSLLSIERILVYHINGTLLGNITGTSIEPGKVKVFTLANPPVGEGELVDILLTTTDGSTFKFRVAVQ